MKLLFDLFPVILFFITFKYGTAYPDTATAVLNLFNITVAEGGKPGIFLATLVAILATALQIIWTKWKHGKIDTMLWVSFGIISVFGGATLLLHDENFIKFKPSALYWLFAAILLISNAFFKKNLMYSLLHEKMALPHRVWNRLNLSWALFFVALGFLNLYVAFNYNTETWVNFKLFGFTGLMFVFVLGQGIWLAKYVDGKKEEN